jgi:hypothetical protein
MSNAVYNAVAAVWAKEGAKMLRKYQREQMDIIQQPDRDS